MSDLRTTADATGTETFFRFVGIAGSSKGAANAVLVAGTPPGEVAAYSLSSGTTTVTLAMIRAGILTATSAGSTTLTLPTVATLGWTPPGDGSSRLILRYQKIGTGNLFINPASGVAITWNDLDPQFLTQYHPVGSLIYSGSVGGVDQWAAT